MRIKNPVKDIPIVVLLLAMVHGLDHAYMISLPAIFPLLMEEMGLTYTQLGFLVSVRGIFGFFQPLAGYLVDRWGARLLLSWCFSLMALAFLGLAVSPSFSFLLFFQLLMGVGGTVVHPASYSLVGRIRGQPLGRRMAFHSFFGFLGTTVGLAFTGAFASVVGWRMALSFLSIPGFLSTFFLLRVQIPPPVDRQKQEAVKTGRGPVVNPLYPLLVLAISGAFQGMFNNSLSSFLPTFLTGTYGLGVARAGFFASILFAGGLIGLLAGGEVTHRVDRVFFIFSLSMGVTLLVLSLSVFTFPPYFLLVFLLVMGFCQFFSTPSRLSLTADVSPSGAEGRAFGLTFGLSYAGGALAAPVTGFLADIFGIQSAFLFVSLMAFLMGVTVLFLKRWRYGPATGSVGLPQ